MSELQLVNKRHTICSNNDFLFIRDKGLSYLSFFFVFLFCGFLLFIAHYFHQETPTFVALFFCMCALIDTKKDISFNKKTGEVIKVHSYFGIALRRRLIFKRYQNFEYAFQYEEISDEDQGFIPVFNLLALSKRTPTYHLFIFRFTIKDDIKTITSFMETELNIIFQNQR